MSASEVTGLGFDVLGWLPDWSGDGAPAPVFLEVKSAKVVEHGRRSFKVSAHEWEIAEDSRAASQYAFCLVGRDADGTPKIELLPNPSTYAPIRRAHIEDRYLGCDLQPGTHRTDQGLLRVRELD